ncbi:CWF19-like protein 1, partial [Lecanoromycetidae sp. Uapishka_2]
MDPNAAPPVALPPGTTATPFTTSKKRQRLPDQEKSFSRFSQDNGYHYRHERPNKRARKAPPGPQECFFCLSNPTLATHLITSIASDSYLTTAKGPLSTASTYPALEFPAHMLIIPFSHSPLIASISPQELRTSTYEEMQRYRHSLHSLLTSASNGALGAVTWEVSRAEGIHIHWQFLPVQAELVKKGLVEAAFKVEAENEKYPFFQEKDIGDGTDETGDYFRVWIWRPEESTLKKSSTEQDDKGDDDDDAKRDESEEDDVKVDDAKGVEKSMMLPLSENFRFDIQFGRRVMAKLLGLEKRMHWQDCTQSDAEEKKDAEKFKASFKDFDFSLEES